MTLFASCRIILEAMSDVRDQLELYELPESQAALKEDEEQLEVC